MAQLRTILIGAGVMGALHARALSQHPDIQLVMIVDPDEERGREVAETWQTAWAPDLDELTDIDAAVVAAPTQFHYAWALRLLENSVPTLVEKPLTLSLSDTLGLLRTAEQRDVPVMCGLLERYNPAVRTMMDIVEEPMHLTIMRHSPYTPRIATDVASDLSVHDIDIAIRLNGGEPIGVASHLARCHPDSPSGSNDVADVNLRFASGMLASLSASRVSQRKIRTLHVAELHRLTEVDLLRRDITVYHHVGSDFLPGRDTGYRQQTVIDIPAIADAREPLTTQLDRFVAIVRGQADKDEERRSILPVHKVLDHVLTAGEPNDEIELPDSALVH
ncbi:MAG: Gfo/Idh/MocA family protein [Acidimicrobiia bacterium]